jgi:hypothetical protein
MHELSIVGDNVFCVETLDCESTLKLGAKEYDTSEKPW